VTPGAALPDVGHAPVTVGAGGDGVAPAFVSLVAVGAGAAGASDGLSGCWAAGFVSGATRERQPEPARPRPRTNVAKG
jgi:phage tail tape-measure protein